MRFAFLAVSLTLLAGCTDLTPQPGDTVSLKTAHPPELIAGERSQVCLLVDATSPAGEVRSVQLDEAALSARIEFFDTQGNLLRYEDLSFEYG